MAQIAHFVLCDFYHHWKKKCFKKQRQPEDCLVTGVVPWRGSWNSKQAWVGDKETFVKYLVQFSCSVVSDSLRPRRLQHARLPCPSPTPVLADNSASILVHQLWQRVPLWCKTLTTDEASNRIYGSALSYLCNISVDIKLFYFYSKKIKINQGQERLSKLPKVTELIHNKSRILNPGLCWSQHLYPTAHLRPLRHSPCDKNREGGRGRRRKEGMDGGRWEGEEKERITRRERDCHVFASFSLFDETGRPKCLLSPPKCIFSNFQLHRGFSSSCAHPPANSYEINSTHPSFYLHHLAEAKKPLCQSTLHRTRHITPLPSHPSISHTIV